MAKERNGGSSANQPFQMPLVPETLGVDPLLLGLLHLAALIDFSDDETVEGDAANDALERLEVYVQRLPTERLEEIQADLDRIEEHGAEHGWAEEMTDFVRDFLYNCGLGEDEDEGEDESEDAEGSEDPED